MFEPFEFRDKHQSVLTVESFLRNGYNFSGASVDSLAALYELSADEDYRNLPISPAYLLAFGDGNGVAAAVMASGASFVGSGHVVTVTDPDRYRQFDVTYARELWSLNDLTDRVIPIVASSCEFGYIFRVPLRLCYVQAFRVHSDDDLQIELEMELEQCLSFHDGCNGGRGWLVVNGYGADTDLDIYRPARSVVDRLLAKYGDWFGLRLRIDSMVCLEYFGGYDELTFDL